MEINLTFCDIDKTGIIEQEAHGKDWRKAMLSSSISLLGHERPLQSEY